MGNLFPCKVQEQFENNMYLKHFLWYFTLLFFVISNFGVWISSSFYSKDIFGIISCYVAAIPFYYGTLSGTIFYSFFLFGSYEFLSRKLSKVT